MSAIGTRSPLRGPISVWALLCFLAVGVPAPAADSLTIRNYEKIAQEIAAGNRAFITYRADLVNPGLALATATAELRTTDPAAIRTVPNFDTLTFVSVPARGQAKSTNTFKILADPAVPLDVTKLEWIFKTTPAPPVASAGPDRTVLINSTVVLDGNLSTNPGGTGPLTYHWTFKSRPPGTSQSRLTFLDTAVTSFAPDAIGQYVLELTVTNGTATSTTLITITVVAALPTLVSVAPSAAQQGSVNAQITINGQNTHFAQGVTAVTLGPGIATGQVNVSTPTSLTAQVTIDGNATVGLRNVTVTTGTEVESLPNGFAVTSRNQAPFVTVGPNQSVNLGYSEVSFTEFPGPTSPTFGGGNVLVDITTGPDGSLWFTENYAQGAQTHIGRITPAGVLTLFPIPSGSSEGGIVTGPDGNVWFTEYRTNKIGRITTGGVVTEFAIPTAGSYPYDIALGPDGNLWFTETFGNNRLTPGAIGRITPAGTITEFSVSSQPGSIIAGPDGNLWFTQHFGNQIGRITPSGVVTQFSLPTSGSYPTKIANGPDGALWFTETQGNRIGRITTSGAINEFSIPTASSEPNYIALGPDGNLWFTERNGNKLVRLTTTGAITEFPIPTNGSEPFGITTGPDGNIWFVELHGNNIVKTILGVFPTSINVPLGGSVSDDGFPAGSSLTATWSASSGPAPVGFVPPAATFPNVAGKANPVGISGAFSTLGTYVLGLAASDSALSTSAPITVTVNPPAAPILLSLSPNTGQQGQQGLAVTITGQFTHFVQGTTTAYFGAGITVGSLTVSSATTAIAVVNIGNGAASGSRRVTMTTGAEVATVSTSFTVAPAPNQPPTVNAGPDQTVVLDYSPIRVTDFPVNRTASTYQAPALTTGPDGNLWFIEGNSEKIAKMNTAGVILGEFTIPSLGSNRGSGTVSLAAGSDGNIWFAAYFTHKIGRITPAGVITAFPIPGTYPYNIVSGPDGNLWFTEYLSNVIGRITTSGVVTEFAVPSGGAYGASGITKGPDGNLWFTVSRISPGASGPTTIGKITPGGAITEYPVAAGSGPYGITSGPDGNLWFTEIFGQKVGRITTSGVVTEFPISGANHLYYIVTGPDGNLWVTDQGNDRIFRVSIAGSVTPFTLPNVDARGEIQGEITIGPDGNLWFVRGTANQLSRIELGVFPTTATATLTGSAVDDGLPANAVLSTAWSLVSGPSAVTFARPTATFPDIAGQSNPVVTAAVFSAPGPHRLALTASDSVLTGTANVTVNVAPPSAPALTTLSPNVGLRGLQNLTVAITGQFTHFVQGQTTAYFGPSVTVSLTVSSPTTATALVNIDSTAPVGTRALSITTGAESVVLQAGFTVLTNLPPAFTSLPPTNWNWSAGTSAGVSPSPRALGGGNPQGYDDVNDRLIVVGGYIDNAKYKDVWVLANATGRAGTPVWTQLAPTGTPPPPIHQHFQAYDPVSNRLVVQGGSPGSVTPLDQTWVLSNANGLGGVPTWSQLPSIPSARRHHAGFFDSATNRLVVFGGSISGPARESNDVWLLSNANGIGAPTWSQIVPGGAAPVQRLSPSANYDPTSNRMIVFGGLKELPTVSNNLNDVWVLTNANGNGGTPQWIQLNAGGILPSGRFGHVATYDSVLNQLLVIGGCIQSPSAALFGETICLNDVWLLKNANGIGGTPIWVQVQPDGGTPAPRLDAIGGYSASSGISVLTTGRFDLSLGGPGPASTDYFNDVWILRPSLVPAIAGQPFAYTATAVDPEGSPVTYSLQTAPSGMTINGATGLVSWSPQTAQFDPAAVTIRAVDPTGLSSLQSFKVLVQSASLPRLVTSTPRQASPTQSLSVTITGQSTHFVQGTTRAGFGSGITVTGLTVISPTQLTAQVQVLAAAEAGLRTIVVVTGAEVVSASNAFTVQTSATPSLTSVTPSSGTPGGNPTVTIAGSNTNFLQGVSQVSFGAGIAVTFASATSATSLTAQILIAPGAALGPRAVTVTLGADTLSLPNGFTVVAPTVPSISVTPAAGQQGQGGPATIVGSNTHFVQGTTQVDYGAGITVSNVAVTCATCLSAQLQIAAGAVLGPRNVTVTTGGEVVSLTNGFTVQSGTPILTTMNPATGRQGQTFTSTITGQFTNWVQGTTTVNLGVGITVNTVTVTSPTTLTLQATIATGASPGLRGLTVTTGAESVSAVNVFTVLVGVPNITLLNPAAGRQGQSNITIAVTGQFTNFVQGSSQVDFGASIVVNSVAVASATSLTANISVAANASIGPRSVVVTTGTEAASLANGFTVTAGPIVSTVDPGGSQQGQTLPVIITGLLTNFAQGVSAVSFGPGITVNSVTVSNPTTLTAQITIAANATPGVRTVTVTTGAEVASFVNGYTVLAGTKGITVIDPGSAQQGQSLPVSITSQFTNFAQGTTTANFGANVTVNSLTVTDATHLTAQISVAAGAATGSRNVTVSTGTEVVTAPNAFTVTATTPTITLVGPSAGQRGQSNLLVAITAQNTHFVQGTSQVDFGGAGVTVNSVTVASATALTANISITNAALLGARPLTITTGAEVVSLPNSFTVTAGTNQAPVITIAPTWSLVLPARLTLTYTSTDDGLPAGGTFTTSWEKITGPGEHGFSDQNLTSISVGFSAAGTYVLRITARDTQLTTFRDVVVTVTGTPQSPPTVSITSPSDGQDITTFADVIGTVNSPGLTSWTLESRSVDDSTFRPFATGTTSVTNAKLGVFDPTLLLNGITLIRLKATDSTGQTTTSPEVSVVLTKNQKIGHFTVSFQDLNVPVAGLGIQLIRTYDTRNTGAGDFGAGWTLDIRNVKLRDNGAVGVNWQGTKTGSGFSTVYRIVATREHLVTVTLSDGSVYKFRPKLSPDVQQLQQIDQVAIGFEQVSGPNATLALVGSNLAFVQSSWPGPLTLFEDGQPADYENYVLTFPDGRKLALNRAFGLQTLTDTNLNKLTITSAGITHSSGKSIAFQRDSAGRITQVTDPAGKLLKYAYNATGDLVSFTDRDNNTSTYSYDGNHRLLKIADPRGIEPIRNEYDSTGRLIKNTDAFGNAISYTHDIANRREIVTDRLGNQTINEYDAEGNVVKVTDAFGGVTLREYGANGNTTKETDPLGRVRSYTYDANDNRLSETDPLSNLTSYVYTALNRVATITDTLGRVTTNTYDANGNLTKTRDALGQETIYTYNSQGLQSSVKNPLNETISFEYDGAGNLIKQTNPAGSITTYTYDGNGNRKTETRTRTTTGGTETLTTQFDYNGENRLVKTTVPDGSTTQVQYNSIGKQSATIDQLARQTTYTYDEMGRLTQTLLPDGTTEKSEYDLEGRRIKSIDRGTRATTYTYDKLGRLTKTTFADGSTSSTDYDAVGQVPKTFDAFGNATQYFYDLAGRRTKVINALTESTSFEYDKAGNQTAMIDGRNNRVQHTYDALNRRRVVTYPDNTTDQTVYDELGRTKKKIDQALRATQYEYDSLGRLIRVIDALGQITAYGYDEIGNRLTQTDAKGRITRFEYDKLGRRTKRTLPLGQSEIFTYDFAGNLKTKRDFNGRTTTYTYDNVNRLTSKIPDPALAEPTVGFTYTASGQRQSMSDASGITTYTYDLRDRVLVKATPQGTLTYTYDRQGNLSSLRSSNMGGTSVIYTYDALNRLKTVIDNRLTPGTTTYNYDAAGNLDNYVYPNGVKHAYTYNALNRLADLKVTNGATSLASYAHLLGPSGNRTRVTELGGRQVDYAYDELYRLKKETIAGGTVNGIVDYTYDAVGNRLSRTSTALPIPSAAYTYDDNDRLASSPSGDAYNANGNTIGAGGNAYAYDFENHLTMQTGSTAVTIVYDGDGNRVSKTVGGTTTRFLVDDRNLTGYAQVLEEVQGATVQRVYDYGLNRISQSQSSGTTFYGYDGHGNVRLLTDSTGAVTDRYDFDAFGNILSQTGNTPNVYLHSGEQSDPNLGFYYLRSRYLNTGTARFITADTFSGDPQSPLSLHKYLYVSANPVNRIDPSGHIGIADVVIALLSSSFDWFQPQPRLGSPGYRGWNASDEQGLRTFIGQSVDSYLGRSLDCADLAITMLVDFAFRNRLRLALTDEGSHVYRWPSTDGSDIVQYKSATRNAIGAAALYHKNTSGTREFSSDTASSARMGDLVISTPTTSVPSWHTRVFLKLLADDQWQWVQGNVTDGPGPVERKEGPLEGGSDPRQRYVTWWSPTVLGH